MVTIEKVQKIEPLETFYAERVACFMPKAELQENYCSVQKVLPNGDKVYAEVRPVTELKLSMDKFGKVDAVGTIEVTVGIPASMKCTYNPFYPGVSGLTRRVLVCEVKKWEL